MGAILQISQILENQKMKDSSAKNYSGLYTSFEAKKLNIRFEKQEPNPLKCEYCHTELYYQGFYNPLTKSIKMWLEPNRCECEGAATYWSNVDDTKEKQRIENEEIERKEALKKKISRLFEQSKIGDRFKKRTFETYEVKPDNKKSYEASLRYAENFQKYKSDGVGLMYSGTCGTGKTHLAAAIANNLLNKGIPVIFGTLINLLGKLRQSYNDEGEETEQEILELYTKADLLIIDDLGKEKPSEWVLEKLYSIINDRYENNKPIIITTNYSMSALTDRLTVNRNLETAEAIASRLNEMCRGVLLNGDDFRKL